jgi:osmotically-inducible protein OsmY
MISPDDELASRVRHALRMDGRLSAQPIKVEVTEGVVTLRGAVQSYRRKLAAHELAASFDGCRGVVNQLSVQPAGQLSDDDVAEHVRNTLHAHADITKETITVAVSNGSVTLSGNVASYWERVIAEDVALSVKGVRDVQNLLVVDLPRQIEDEALCREMRAAFAQARGLRGQDIDVAVTGDVAVLSGKVRELWHKEQAESVARRFRIRDVRNDIVVTRRD